MKSPNTYTARKHTNTSVAIVRQPLNSGHATATGMIWKTTLWPLPALMSSTEIPHVESIGDDWLMMEALGINDG